MWAATAVGALALTACGGESGAGGATAPAALPSVTATTAPVMTAPASPPPTMQPAATTGADTSPPRPVSTVMDGLPDAISCGVYYRPFGDASTEGAIERSVVLDTSGQFIASDSAELEKFEFNVSYSGPDMGDTPSVSIAVLATNGDVLTSVLYQLGSPDLGDIQFTGDHGFTGLHYVYSDGAQLQFWCSAD